MRILLSYLLLLLIMLPQLNAQDMKLANPAFCDPVTGLCTIAPIEGDLKTVEYRDDVEIIYVGDPMCSWCWGISPQLRLLQVRAAQEGIPYRIVVGGLRPGGGDPWNQQFKDFLRHHWEEVAARSGQPFAYELFDQAAFNYDTEPSCRAVVAARTINPEQEHRFFELVQHYFYVKNGDPSEVAFYEPICAALEMDYLRFSELFASNAIREATVADFQLNRQWGVSGYPTVILRQGKQLVAIARGYAEFEQMWSAVESVLVKE